MFSMLLTIWGICFDKGETPLDIAPVILLVTTDVFIMWLITMYFVFGD